LQFRRIVLQKKLLCCFLEHPCAMQASTPIECVASRSTGSARPQRMQAVDPIDIQRTRTWANRLIINGLIAILLLPALITLTLKFKLFGAAWGWQVFSWGLGTFYGLASLCLGLVLRLTSRGRGELQTVDAGTEAFS